MTAKRVAAVAIAVLFGVTSFACLISAEEDEGPPLIITAPSGDDPISCAVFYADNMVYAPQWRLDNYVRVETMVIDMTGLTSARDIPYTATDLYPSIALPEPLLFANGLEQQAAIIANSEEILPLTRMVSVSYIEVLLTNVETGDSQEFAAGWNPVDGSKVIELNGFGREVNKAGHVIYGTLWDTTGFDVGVYKTEVRLGSVVQDSSAPSGWRGVVGEWYSVDYSIAHLYDPAVEGAYVTPECPYSDLVEEDEIADFNYTTYKIGVGGVDLGTDGFNFSWLDLGPLIPQGTGGGNGGGGNQGDGNGNGGDGGGNGNGNLGDGGGGNGHGGKLSRLHGAK